MNDQGRQWAVFRVVVLVWLAGTILSVTVNTASVGWDSATPGSWASGRESLAFSLVSGVLAITSMSPIWVMGRDAFPTGYFVAGAIRVGGAVALFFAAGYTSRASDESIAAWILGWHAVLLLAEVVWRARLVDNTSSPPLNDPSAGPSPRF